MAKRKQTPDVLAEILGGELPNGDMPPAAQKGTRPARAAAARAPQAGPQQRAPKQWDYMLVSFQDYKGWRPRFMDGQELKDWTSGPLIHQYLEQMGKAGWELAAAGSGERLYGSADNHQLYFKRPK